MLAFTPEHDFDIFFSYATIDDEPRARHDDFRWVTNLRDVLIRSIEKKLGRNGSVADFFDRRKLGSQQQLGTALRRAIDSSALFVCVVAPAY